MATLSSVLAAVRQHESSGNYSLTPQQNYAYSTGTTHASGAYQFQPATWQHWTQASGIGTQYSEAYQAPPNVQDAVAAYALTNQSGGANSTALWGGPGAPAGGYQTVTENDVSPQQIAAGPSSGLSGSQYTGLSSTSGTGWNIYTVLGADGQPTGALVSGSSEADASQYLGPGEHVGPITQTFTQGGTGSGTPGTGSGSSGSGSGSGAAGAAGAAGADVGYVPPASTGGPQYQGLAAGTVASISGWINGIESAVGNAFKNAMSGLLGGIESQFIRALVFILAVVLLLVALWRLMDPDGSKTKAFVREAAVAA
jgi:hypothetical protein